MPTVPTLPVRSTPGWWSGWMPSIKPPSVVVTNPTVSRKRTATRTVTRSETMRRDETPPQAVTTARVVVLLDASRHSLAALAAAVELAGRQRAELVALHVEDTELLHCSAFPFACEIGAQSGLSRPLTSSSLAATIDQQRKRVTQTLLAAVAGRQLKHRLEISRGAIV